MNLNRALTLCLTGFCSLLLSPAYGKDSTPVLPAYVLQGRTVAVLVDPGAGVDLNDPNANQTAQRDVEAALLKWGRFTPTLALQDADIIVVIRKGHGKLVTETASDPRQNRRPGSVTRADDTISVGAQHGTQPINPHSQTGIGSGPDAGAGDAHPQMEIGSTNDSFAVYEGKTDDPTNGPPAWRWDHKNGLHSHDVPAVDEFRKAIAAAEKAAQAKHP